MTFPVEYHKDVKSRVEPSIPAALALCGMLLLPLLLVSSSSAQVNNASATSAHASAPAPSAAPPVRSAVPDKSPVVVVPPKPHPPQPPIHNPNGNQHNPPNVVAYYPYFYPMPYAVDASADADTPDASSADADATDASNDSANNNDNDPEYQGGPTIFDRRGPGHASYVANASPTQSIAEAQVEDAAADSDPEPPQAPTILVFKDGHQLEVSNYAIVNPTLYDLTPGHPRKIALSDLDLPATEKLNDDHGIVFELPPSAQAN
ncbi:MAG: hypothetical protein WAM78_20985 [Candidatus Sulfotelmatobacter sp.]